MKRKKNRDLVLPTEEEVQSERKRLKHRRRFIATLRTTVYALIVVAAVAVLLATLFLPVLQVSGSSMEPTLSDDDIILLIKTDNLQTGDLIGFYYQNKLLLKRVIGVAGDTIDIDEEGNVTVNGELLDEPYVTNKSIGECDIDLPYQVPENRVFVMGDNRATSIDSRSSAIGCIEEDQIVGKVLVRIYPFNKISVIN
ncbi:MAG: signal peptidase I [Oscillospiraceae bacterium]|nr:signal peptidase I [Oscillospiraceae bacterium]